ncbi:MAG TPA: FAD-binding oxidoreductase [Flavobacteriales bacterium]|nr:FAD-binding oxidoreductase [Flavobacteriales bacterium]
MQTPNRTLIVGAGLSGILMAWELEKRGVDYEVWQSPDSSLNFASRVAAGMFNPVSFKRLVSVWNAVEHMEIMRKTYLELEEFLNLKGAILHSSPILRVFPNAQYRDLWAKRLDDAHEVSIWLNEIDGVADVGKEGPEEIIAPFGFGIVRDAGWVDLPLLLNSFNSHLQSKGRFFANDWSFNTQTNDTFNRIIDCRGVGASSDLASVGIKVQADHGEVLTLRSRLDTKGMCINRVKWLLPRGDSVFKLGATYKWNIEQSAPTDEGRTELLSSIRPIISPEVFDEFEVLNHESGLRPASTDRRPYAGPVPGNDGLFILNGLGTRGVLVGPATAAHLANHMFDGTPLPQDVSLARLKSLRD